MSRYTAELRWVVEQEESKYSSPAKGSKYHASTYAKLGLDSYPIWDTAYRNLLNDKIIDHYYFNEIGSETVALFAWEVRRKMNEVMPWYVKMWEAQELITDPLTDYGRKHHEERNLGREDVGKADSQWGETGSSTTDVSETGKLDRKTTDSTHDRNVFQDTPMSMLGDGEPSAVSNLEYATTVTYDDYTSNGTLGDSTVRDSLTDASSRRDGTRNDATNDKRNEKELTDWETVGYNSSQAELLDKYRKYYMNIDLLIIDELKTFFMGLW